MNAYPLMSNTKPMPMSIEDYHRIAEPMYYSNASDYSILFDFNSWAKKYAANDLINKVKSELNYGNRVVIGVLVPNTDYLGLNASNKAEHDTWTLTPQIEQALQMLSFIFTNLDSTICPISLINISIFFSSILNPAAIACPPRSIHK